MNKPIFPCMISLFFLIAFAAYPGQNNAMGQAVSQVGSTATAANNNPQLVIQLGHSGSINAAAFSPDGRLVVSGGDDPIAIVWEAATGRVIRRLVGHKSPVTAVAFSPDGRFILTGSGDSDETGETKEKPDNTARLWDAATGKELRRFVGHTARIGVAEFSPDGQFVLTASEDGTARLWSAATGRVIRRFVERGASVIKVAQFSPDGRFVVTGGGDYDHEDYTIRLWDAATGAVVQRFVGYQHPVGALAFSPDGQLILSSGEKPIMVGHEVEDVRLWNLKTGKMVKRFAAIGPAVFSPDGKFILTGHTDEKINFKAALWDVNTGTILRLLKINETDPQAISDSTKASRDSAKKSSNSADKTSSENSELEDSGGGIEAVAFSPDGQQVLVVTNPLSSGGSGGFTSGITAMVTFDLASGTEVRRFQGVAEAVPQVAFASDSNLIRAGNALWSSSTGQAIRFKETTGEDIRKIFITSLSADGRFALTSNSNGEDNSISEVDENDANAQSNDLRLWDLTLGKELARYPKATEALLSADGRFVLTMEETKEAAEPKATKESEKKAPLGSLLSEGTTARLWETSSGKELWHFDFGSKDYSNAGRSYFGRTPSNADWMFSPDSRYVMIEGIEATVLLNAADGTTVKSFDGFETGTLPLLAISPDNRFFATGSTGSEDASVHLWDMNNGREVWNLRDPAGTTTIAYSLAFTPNGRFLLANEELFNEKAQTDVRKLRLLDVAARREIRQFDGQSSFVYAFSPDSRFLLTVDASANVVNLWSIPTGEKVQQFVGHLANVTSVAFSPDGRFVLTGSSDSTTRVWAAATGHELCRLVSFTSGAWAVIAPDGRFDTNDLEEIKGLQWIVPDAPFTPLPLEIFIRDYYEPRLLPRLLAGEKFKDVPSLANLNRVQPKVEIKEISKPDEQGRVSVTVAVARAKSETQRDAQGNLLETGVYDLRLFRDGQLVGYEPDKDREVRLEKDGTRTVKFENIRLPRKAGVKSVEFSAYAFNVDQVKSATARKSVDIPDSLQPLKGRAYLITVGVNAHENTAFDLNFAANDARRLQDVIAKSLLKSGEYEEKAIVQIPLISDYKTDGGKSVVSPNNATKRVFKAVLDLLSGKKVDDPELLKQIPNPEQIQAARPEDLVLISFSSHGYAAPNGDFYFITSDTGPGTGKKPTPELLKHAVSSEELSLWLRDVDAGEMVMIVDACQSTAAVAAAGFKPGPMDSRGLGQLSYDKGMKILTATQSDSVALESHLIKQGLLTYALVHDGIEAGQADFKPQDKSITLSEWLAYGVNRVPGLYEEVRQGKVQTFGRAVSENEAQPAIIRQDGGTATGSKSLDLVEIQDIKIQQPSLFDFTKKQKDVVLVRK
jgi:WD40 repeat protein